VWRVGTFNIHAGVGRDGIRNLDRTAVALFDLDIVALQEVRNPLSDALSGSLEPQVAQIAELSKMAWMFVPAEKRWWHNEYGTALLTGVPLTSWVRIPLQTFSRQRFRTALLATFYYRNRAVRLLTVHIDKDSEQGTHDLQLRTVFDVFVALREPAILLGDLNEVETHPEFARLLSTPGVHNALAQVPRTGIRKAPVDWILTKGFRTVRGEWKENPASDHPVAKVELELADETVGTPERIGSALRH